MNRTRRLIFFALVLAAAPTFSYAQSTAPSFVESVRGFFTRTFAFESGQHDTAALAYDASLASGSLAPVSMVSTGLSRSDVQAMIDSALSGLTATGGGSGYGTRSDGTSYYPAQQYYVPYGGTAQTVQSMGSGAASFGLGFSQAVSGLRNDISSGSVPVSSLTVTSLNCSGKGNGGKLTTDAKGNVYCADDEGIGGSGGSSGIAIIGGMLEASSSAITGSIVLGADATSTSATLEAHGDAILYGAGNHINFGTQAGDSGYGLRDNGGVIQLKNSSGAWANIPTSVYDLGDAGASARGLVSTTTQSFAGAKTFTGSVTVNGTLALGSAMNGNGNRLTNIASPTAASDAATKGYIDTFVTTGITWASPVLGTATGAPATSNNGDRYIIGDAGAASATGCSVNQIATRSGGAWVCSTPAAGATSHSTADGQNYTWNGTAWISTGTSTTHDALLGLQGGNGIDQFYHLDLADYTALTATNAQLASLQTTGMPTFAGLSAAAATVGGLTVTGSITAGGSPGTNGYLLVSTGSGVQWVSPSSLGITGGGGTSGIVVSGGVLEASSTAITGQLVLGANATSTSAVFEAHGDAILYGSGNHINFGTATGDAGYGLRDNGGTLQFKNSGGAWADLGSGGGSSQWGTAGSSIYYATGSVGIGTTSPYTALAVNGTTTALAFTATSTTLASTFPLASTTLLTVSSQAYIQNLLALGSTTLQGLSFMNATGTAATTTSFYAQTASSTNLFATNMNAASAALGGLTVSGSAVFSGPLSFLNSGTSMLLSTDSTGHVVSTSSPQVATIYATSTTATSTFLGGLVIGRKLAGSGPSLVADWSSGYVGVGTNQPNAQLSVSGDISIAANGHLSFGAISGDQGYGFRDNNGVIQMKNTGKPWVSIPTTVYDFGDAGPTTRGFVSTTTQSFVGTKTFLGDVSVGGTLSLSKPLDAGSNRIGNVGAPTAPEDAATKGYVDTLVTTGITWASPVLGTAIGAPATSNNGDRYIIGDAGAASATGCSVNQIATRSGGTWVCSTPSSGTTTHSQGDNQSYTWNGTAWVSTGTATTHNALPGVQGGNGIDEFYHLDYADYDALASAGAQLSALKATGTPLFASVSVTGGYDVSTGGSYKYNGSRILWTPGSSNYFIGASGNTTSIIGDSNIGIGDSALAQLTSGNSNIAIGVSSLAQNTTGSLNVAVGHNTLSGNSTGIDNSAFGEQALAQNTTGSLNTAVGNSALTSNSGGSNNTAVGNGTLIYADGGSEATVVGANSNAGVNGHYANRGATAIGYSTGYNLGNGSDYNTFIGYKAGYDVTTGQSNTFLGQFPSMSNGITTGSYNILIGNDVSGGLSPTGSNQLNIGNLIYGTALGSSTVMGTGNVGIGTSSPYSRLSVEGQVVATNYVATSSAVGFQAANLLGGVTTLSVDANGDIIRTPSDQNLKTDIQPLSSSDALAKLLRLQGVSYQWKDTARFGSGTEIGFIAQQVEPIVPEVVKDGGAYKSLNYGNMVALVVEAVKELDAKLASTTAAARDMVMNSLTAHIATFDTASVGSLTANSLTITGTICAGNVCADMNKLKALILQSGGVVSGSAADVPVQGSTVYTQSTATDTAAATTSSQTATTTPDQSAQAAATATSTNAATTPTTAPAEQTAATAPAVPTDQTTTPPADNTATTSGSE